MSMGQTFLDQSFCLTSDQPAHSDKLHSTNLVAAVPGIFLVHCSHSTGHLSYGSI